MKNRSIETYNALYNSLKSKLSSRSLHFGLNTFFDGSAAITITVTYKNANISLSVLIVPEFDEKENIIRYRVSEEDKITYVKNLTVAMGVVYRTIQGVRILLSKV